MNRPPRARVLDPGEAEWLEHLFNSRWPWPRVPGFVSRVVGEGPHLVAESADGQYLGHCRIRPSLHQPFHEEGIPEIADLNVMPECRRQGAATALLELAESLIVMESEWSGIGVGIYSDYGPAQRLYSSRGYSLDGTGAWWNNEPVSGGATVIADDDLVLYLSKRLR